MPGQQQDGAARLSLLRLIKPIPRCTAEALRELMRTRDPRELQLADVRQPADYARAHLPGARSMPLADLRDRAAELQPEHTAVVYCDNGLRSRAGAAILVRAGFRDARYLAGGFAAWNGALAQPIPDADMTVLTGAETLPELIALAWLLEDGSRRLYETLADSVEDGYAAWAFKEVAGDERYHQRALEELHQRLLHVDVGAGFPYNQIERDVEDFMEGGMRLSQVLAWAEGRDYRDAARLASALEANAYDLHLGMERGAADRAARQVFRKMALMEARHLKKMLDLLTDADDRPAGS